MVEFDQRKFLTELLREVYASTHGNEWERQEGYFAPILPLEKWRGVSYEDDKLKLSLEENNLSGILPERIGDFSYFLVELNLRGNHIEGEIPNSFSRLVSLVKLDLSNNNLGGTFKNSILSLTSLTSLNLSSNHFTDVIPPKIENLSALRSLDLHENHFSGGIPTSISSLLQLLFLDLSCNELTGVIPEGLGDLKNLTDLILHNNSLAGTIPSQLGHLCSLVHLDLSHNKLTGKIPTTFGGRENSCFPLGEEEHKEGSVESGESHPLPRLSILVSDRSIERVGNSLHNLCYLNLSNNMLHGAIPKELWSLRQLKHLDLSHNQFSGFLSEGIVEMELKYLDITYNQLIEKCVVNAARNDLEVVKQWKKLDRSPITKEFNPLNYQYPSVDLALRYPCMWVCNLRALAYSHRPLGRFHRIQPKLLKFLKRVLRSQSVHVLHMVLEVYKGLQKAARSNSTDQAELLNYSHLFGAMILEIFSCDAFDNDSVVMDFLRSNHTSLSGGVPWMYYWVSADIFARNEFLVECLKCGFKQIFACPQVSSRINFILWGHPIFSNLYGDEEFNSYPTYLLFSSMRSHPLAMYALEGVSRVVLLGLLFQVLVNYSPGMCVITRGHDLFTSIVLVLFIFSGVLYKIGQFCDSLDSRKEIKVYLTKIWNITDLWIYGLLTIWVVCYLCCLSADVGKVTLALAAIPTSLSLMRYLSMRQEFGKLVIMIFGNITHLITFGVIFFTAILGFAISFYGLFRLNGNFSTYGDTFLTLFNAAVGNVDFATFDTDSHRINLIGQFVMVCYVCTITLVVLNLLIARMASTYDEIQYQSREHWSYAKAETTAEYMLYYERNPFCMLPPPFNLIPTLLSPYHYWHLSSTLPQPVNVISISGTASNIVLWFLGLLPRVILIIYSRVDEKISEISRDFRDTIFPQIIKYWNHSNWNSFKLLILSIIFIPIFIPLALIFFLLILFLVAPVYFTVEQLILFVAWDPNIVTIVQRELKPGGKYLIRNGRLDYEQMPSTSSSSSSFTTPSKALVDNFGYSPPPQTMNGLAPRTPLRKNISRSLSTHHSARNSRQILFKKFTLDYYMYNTTESTGIYFKEPDIVRILSKVHRNEHQSNYFTTKMSEEIVLLRKQIEKNERNHQQHPQPQSQPHFSSSNEKKADTNAMKKLFEAQQAAHNEMKGLFLEQMTSQFELIEGMRNEMRQMSEEINSLRNKVTELGAVVKVSEMTRQDADPESEDSDGSWKGEGGRGEEV